MAIVTNSTHGFAICAQITDKLACQHFYLTDWISPLII